MLFYDLKYLKGRWFHGTLQGIKWIISGLFWQKIVRINARVPFPCSPDVRINNPKNIIFHPDDLNNFWNLGLFIDASHNIVFIGHGTYIGTCVSILTTKRDFIDPSKHAESKPIYIGRNCWIGSNSIILPGVTLADNTVVGAGSVVTKSFLDGHCVIAGNPAKEIKRF
jgi:acetyltransferase-like isoleucine patch superfamily enzyme